MYLMHMLMVWKEYDEMVKAFEITSRCDCLMYSMQPTITTLLQSE